MHYLDNFFNMAPPNPLKCSWGLQGNLSVWLWDCSGVSVSPYQLNVLTSQLSLLGICIATKLDTPSGQVSCLRVQVAKLEILYKCELLSLTRQLQQACRVVVVRRTFIQRMINLSAIAREFNHWVHPNQGFWSDLRQWNINTIYITVYGELEQSSHVQ